MKKLTTLAFLALTLFAVSTAEAQVQMVASTSTKAIGAVAAGTASADTLLGALNAETKAYPIGNASDVVVSVYSDAGSSCTVQILTAPTSSGPWFDVTVSTPITNPSATGEQWSIPRHAFVKVKVSAYVSGNVRAVIFAREGKNQIY